MSLLLLFQSVETPAPTPINVDLRDLLCSPRITLEDYQSFVQEFNLLIEGQDGIPDSILEYLDQCTEDGELTYEDRDCWITYIAQVNLAPAGRTFGVANPTNITEADPLGLMNDLDGNLRPDVLIIDTEGQNENQTQLDAPVQVTLGSNNCRTPSGVLAKNPAGLMTAGFLAYNYQFLTRVIDLDEDGGAGNRRRFLQDAATVPDTTLTGYFRFSENLEVDRQIYLGKQPDAEGAVHLKKIVLRGYPTDGMPIIRCSSQITQGTPDTIAGNAGDAGQASSAIRIGANTTQGRHNLWWRWLHFVGHRTAEFNGVTGEVFALPIFWINVAGNDRIGFDTVKFTDWIPITSDNSQATLFSDYVDIALDDRADSSPTAIFNRSNNFTIKNCYFRAAITNRDNVLFPYWEYGADTPGGVGRGIRNEGGNNFELANSKFEGFCSGDYVGVVCRTGQEHITGVHIHHNLISSNGYKSLLLVSGDIGVESISGIVEDNFIYNNGTLEIQNNGGLVADFYPGEGNLIVRRNTFAQYIDGQIVDEQVTSNGVNIRTVDLDANGSSVGGVEFYENILWKVALEVGAGNGWQHPDTILNTNLIYDNLFYGLLEHRKQENSGLSANDSPVIMGMYPNSLMGSNVVSDNNIARNLSDLNATVAMSHEEIDNVATQYTVDDEIIPGYERNTAIQPNYTDPNNGDFTLPIADSLLDHFSSVRHFRREDIQQWDYNPLIDFCVVIITPPVEIQYPSIYAAMFGHFDIEI